MATTAKILVSNKTESGEGDARQASVSFYADYADGRNKEWSLATPSLSMTMTLKGPVADQFEIGKRYTLTFTEDVPDEAPQPAAGDPAPAEQSA